MRCYLYHLTLVLCLSVVIGAPVTDASSAPCSGAFGKSFTNATYGQKVWLCGHLKGKTWVAPTMEVYNAFEESLSSSDDLGLKQATVQGYLVPDGTLALHLGYANFSIFKGDLNAIKVRLYSGDHKGEIAYVPGRWVQPAEPHP